MRRLFIAFLLLSAGAARAQNVAGDWNGTLDTGAAKLHLVLHIANAGGALRATLDSVDQNAIGIPVKSVTLTGAKLSLDVAEVHGTFEGTVNGDTITGTWSQGLSLPLAFTRATTKVAPSDIDGAWSGTLGGGATKLPLLFHIINTATGLHASIDSPDQGANGIPVATVTRDGASIRFDVPIVGGSYAATITNGEMNGTWSQNGKSQPLVLHRANAAELERKHPREPKAPFPYDVREVTFDDAAAHVTLAGTLTMPHGNGPVPAVVLIAGSGPHDRDEALLGHKPFLVLADYLSRHGIAVLRYDKRGIGKSGGNYALATTADFADDAEAAFTFAKTVGGIDAHRVGLVGHSEGGVIAPMVAARRDDVALVVLMAGSGVTGDRILMEQLQLIAAASGASADEVKRGAARQADLITLVKSNASGEKFRALLKGTMPDAAIDASVAQLTSPWLRAFIALDPAVALRKVKCPLLAIAGSRDLQVPPEENLAAIRNADPHAETRVFPGLNHLFQHATSGSPAEYARIEETMAPEVLEAIAKRITALH